MTPCVFDRMRLAGALALALWLGAIPALASSAGESAPAFALKNLDGKEVDLAGLRGRFVVLNFWATWCLPCKIEMPSLEKLHHRFKTENLSVLLISNDMFGDKVVRPYLENQRLTLPVLLDQTARVSAHYGVVSLPTTFLIDPDGKILGAHEGAQDWATPEAFLYFEDLLKKDKQIRLGKAAAGFKTVAD